jgi:hypothetical protein
MWLVSISPVQKRRNKYAENLWWIILFLDTEFYFLITSTEVAWAD